MSDQKKDERSQEDSDATQPAEKPVSLHPLKFEEAVRGLLRISPEKTGGKGGKTGDN